MPRGVSCQLFLLLGCLFAMCNASYPPSVSPSTRRQLRWYLGAPSRVEGLILGDNPNHLLNTSVSLRGATGGIYQCCNTMRWHLNGSLDFDPVASPEPSWNRTVYAEAGIDTFVTVVVPTANCTNTGQPTPGAKSCVSPGDVCQSMIANPNFAEELISMSHTWGLKGINLDWEFGYGNNLTCFVELWGQATQKMRAAGHEP